MITQRESVSHRVSLDLSERAKQFGILLDDIAIVSLMKFFLYIYMLISGCNVVMNRAVADGISILFLYFFTTIIAIK